MSHNYKKMMNMASHGNASNCNCGNARNTYQMANNYTAGAAGGYVNPSGCMFAAPQTQCTASRVYCNPAPFATSGCSGAGSHGHGAGGGLIGGSYFNLRNAYGQSRIMNRF